jgi:flavin reductase (DIM6/NTAB) family NADH-FMN oxidoreductase RutF
MMQKRMISDPTEVAGDVFAKTRSGILLTTKADGKVNTMVIGWGHLGTLWGMPTFLAFVRSSRFTYGQLGKNPEFTVNVPREERLNPDIMRVAGTESGRDEDKVAKLGLTLVEPEVVSVPAIAEVPITLECQVIYRQQLSLDDFPSDVRARFYAHPDEDPQDAVHTMFVGKVVASYEVVA